MKLKLILTFFFFLIWVTPVYAASDAYLVELGKVYARQGKYQAAKIEFNKALALNPSNQDAASNLSGLSDEKSIDRESDSSSRVLRKIGVFTGFLDEKMSYEHDHRGMSLLVSLGFDARPAFSKIGLNTKGGLDFLIEPFFNTIFRPKKNVEVGANFMIEYAFPLTDWIQPYIKGGLGIVYMTQHITEQATQYNFLPQGAAGIHLRLKENLALTCEYRHRHLSNAGIEKPNKGIDAKMYLAGLTFFFQ